MTFSPVRLTSIHGRRLALSSTGAIVDSEGYGSVMKSTADVVQNSTALMFSQVGVNPQSGVSSSVASTLTSYGWEPISSGTATAISFEIAAPVAGVSKEIFIGTSASEATFGSPTTAIVFKPAIAGVGSSMFFSAVNLAGTTIVLRGVSTSQWAVTGSTTALTIG